MNGSNKFDIYDDFDIYTIEDTDYAERDEEGEILEGKKFEEKALKHVLNDELNLRLFTRALKIAVVMESMLCRMMQQRNYLKLLPYKDYLKLKLEVR